MRGSVVTGILESMSAPTREVASVGHQHGDSAPGQPVVERVAWEGPPVTVVGAGIAGLGAAMALQRRGASVVVLDRDPETPSMDPHTAFEEWRRPGVLHLRQSHVFLGLLYRLLRDEYPDLMELLLTSGCRELRFGEGLPPRLAKRYRPAPGDDDMTFLSSRRTTLELLIRRYVEQLGGVEIRTDVRVTGLRTAQSDVGPPRVRCLQVEGPHGIEEMECGLLIDASGRRTAFPEWLSNAGVCSREDHEDAEILYFTRHYRLLPGQEEPERGDIPANGDLVYLKFGVFPGDNGCFSITLALPKDEAEVRRMVMKEEGFDRICAMLPGVRAWTDRRRSRPTTKVWGMGGLDSSWRSYRDAEGRPSIVDFFAIGDAAVRSNPMYGRGCSAGFVQADLLGDVLSEVRDPLERVESFERRVEQMLRPYFEDMRSQDRQSIRRVARFYDDDPAPPTLKGRIARSFVEDGVLPATRGSVSVLRGALRSLHMLEPPRVVFSNPRLLARILAVWLMPKPLKKSLYLPKIGPTRDELLEECDGLA